MTAGNIPANGTIRNDFPLYLKLAERGQTDKDKPTFDLKFICIYI